MASPPMVKVTSTSREKLIPLSPVRSASCRSWV
jgi:hypothetical protein